MSENPDEARRMGYRHGYSEGYKNGYKKGFKDGSQKTKRRKACSNVLFMKIRCVCGAINFHPIFENRLVINEDEARRCCGCGRVVSRDDILAYYSRLQSNSRT